MLVLVNYHMDTLSGIGYRSEHIHGGYPCTLVDMYIYGERRIHTLSRVYAWCGDQGWAKLVLIALEHYSVALKRLTFNLR